MQRSDYELTILDGYETYVERHVSEEDDFVELRQVCKEVICSWSLGRSVPVLSLPIRRITHTIEITHVPCGGDEHVVKLNQQSVRSLMRRRQRIREESLESWFVKVLSSELHY